MTDTGPSNTFSTCTAGYFEVSCPIIPPMDGHGGTCYETPFAIPVCSTANYTNIHPHHVNNVTSFAILDNLFYQPLAKNAVTHSIAFALATLTLVNVVVLTPSHKRRLPIHTAIFMGLVFHTLKEACSMYLFISGAPSSAYLNVTNDWASTAWTRTYRATTFLVECGAVLSFAAVQIALAIQAKCLLVWLKVKYRVWVYYVIFGSSMFQGFCAWAFRSCLGLLRVRWVAFVQQGEWFFMDTEAYEYARTGTMILMSISLACWSLCFFISTLCIILGRRKVLFSTTVVGVKPSDTMAPLRPRRSGVFVSAYESALRTIAIVAVESFIVPIVLCVVSMAPGIRKTPFLDSFVLSCVLALLPMSSLFVGNKTQEGEQSKCTEHPRADQYDDLTSLPVIASAPANGGDLSHAKPTELNVVIARSKDTTVSNGVDEAGMVYRKYASELGDIDRISRYCSCDGGKHP